MVGKRAARLSPELRFVVACCRWPHTPAAVAAVRAAAAGGLDWDKVLVTARRHRVRGLVGAATAAAGLPVPAALAEEVRSATMRSLRLAAATLRLDALLGAAGVPAVFVKGAALAARVYADAGIKESVDIDVAVAEGDVARAAAALAAGGFVCVAPAGFDEVPVASLVRYTRESCWLHGDHTQIDLHWRLIESATMMPALRRAPPSRPIGILRGTSVATLPDAELFAYLCVHGAEHGWLRLKWLADLGALVADLPEGALERFAAAAIAGGAARCVRPALTLCRDLLGLAVPPHLTAQGPVERLLVRMAIGAIGHSDVRDSGPAFVANLPLIAVPFLFERGTRARLVRLRSLLVENEDLARGRFRGGWMWLYPVARVGTWLRRKAALARPLRDAGVS